MSAAVHPRTEVRLIQAADLKAVAAVERAAYKFPWSLGIFRDCLLAGYHCLVLDVGGSVTGYGIMSVASREAHLLNLCVHPHAQHLGYGRRLLGHLLQRADEAGAERVFLEVRPSNTVAQQLYRSVGFEQIGIRPAYYQAECGREDAIVLAFTLPPSH
ncbi:MAG: ribosomal protein S18-alanine N-acetyltransferase [Gammaproteobacteria bacterium]